MSAKTVARDLGIVVGSVYDLVAKLRHKGWSVEGRGQYVLPRGQYDLLAKATDDGINEQAQRCPRLSVVAMGLYQRKIKVPV